MLEEVTFNAVSEEDARGYLSRQYSHLRIVSLRDTGKKGHSGVRGTLWKAELAKQMVCEAHGCNATEGVEEISYYDDRSSMTYLEGKPAFYVRLCPKHRN